MPRPNPLLNEILEALHPEKRVLTPVTFGSTTWVFQSPLSYSLEEWVTRKIPQGTIGTAGLYTASRLPELVASTVSINGKDLRTIFADDLKTKLSETISQVQGRTDLKEDEKTDTIEDLLTQTSLDLLYDWMSSQLSGTMVRELYTAYEEQVKKPQQKKQADFFDSSEGTSATPSTPQTTGRS